MSVATTKGASDNDKAARLASGLHMTLFDKGDRRGDRDFQRELSQVAVEAMKRFPVTSINQAENEKQAEQIKDFVAAQARPIRERYARKHWNASSAVIGIAPTWISRTGTRDTIAWDGGSAWGSLAYGFDGIPGLEDTGQVILHARYRNKERVPEPDRENEYYIQDLTVVAAKARIGTVSTIGSFELAYQHAAPRGRVSDNYLRITIGAEKRLTDNLWLQFGVGGESGRRDNRNHLLLLTTLKWGFQQKGAQ